MVLSNGWPSHTAGRPHDAAGYSGLQAQIKEGNIYREVLHAGVDETALRLSAEADWPSWLIPSGCSGVDVQAGLRTRAIIQRVRRVRLHGGYPIQGCSVGANIQLSWYHTFSWIFDPRNLFATVVPACRSGVEC